MSASRAGASLADGVIAARVDRDSMEPLVTSGSIVLFRRPAPRNHRGRAFLVQHRGAVASDDGGASLLKLVDDDPRSAAQLLLPDSRCDDGVDPVRQNPSCRAHSTRIAVSTTLDT